MQSGEWRDITSTAREFFEACEAGMGWDACQKWSHHDATFSCQSDVLADISTLAGYCEWMKALLGLLPDGSYELKALATDAARVRVVAAAVFRGTHTGDGGPVPPTGSSVEADYAYVMDFDGGRIKHMTKIWNDAQTLRALGWA